MKNILFAQFCRSPPFLDSPVKGTASLRAKREQGQYVAQNAFLARLQKGKPGTRPTSPARCATYWSSYIDFLECSCDVVLLAPVIRPRHVWSHYLCASYGTNVEILRFTRDSRGTLSVISCYDIIHLLQSFKTEQDSIEACHVNSHISKFFYYIIIYKYCYLII